MKLRIFVEELRLNKLLLSDSISPDVLDLDIETVSCDSRKIAGRALFFTKGVSFKKEYLLSAIEQGAAAYVSEVDFGVNIPLIQVSDLRKAMPVCADVFYSAPYSAYPLIGITGTKGKTSTAYMLRNIFNEAFSENKNGIISTNEALCGTRKLEKTGTTPEALELFGILNEFARDGVKAAVMEVSSQALQYDRVDRVGFDVGIFLNLSNDHISPTEHHSFEEYKAAKLRMMTLCRRGIVNIDDPYADEVIAEATCEKLFTVSANPGKEADFTAKDVILSRFGSSFRVKSKLLGDTVFELRLPGAFNVNNALTAIAAATLIGIDEETIAKGLEKTVIRGRMEIFEKNGITVLVDYAHNKVSFEALFDYVDTFYPESRKICLFGCTGNKALDRRRELPDVAGKHADFIVLTSDDPANEEPRAIMDEVELELKKNPVPYVMIEDRETAVGYAVRNAKKGDVIILAGKGHETTQQVRGHAEFYRGDMPTAMAILDEK